MRQSATGRRAIPRRSTSCSICSSSRARSSGVKSVGAARWASRSAPSFCISRSGTWIWAAGDPTARGRELSAARVPARSRRRACSRCARGGGGRFSIPVAPNVAVRSALAVDGDRPDGDERRAAARRRAGAPVRAQSQQSHRELSHGARLGRRRSRLRRHRRDGAAGDRRRGGALPAPTDDRQHSLAHAVGLVVGGALVLLGGVLHARLLSHDAHSQYSNWSLGACRRRSSGEGPRCCAASPTD